MSKNGEEHLGMRKNEEELIFDIRILVEEKIFIFKKNDMKLRVIWWKLKKKMAKKIEKKCEKNFIFPAGSFTTVLGVSQSGWWHGTIFLGTTATKKKFLRIS